MATYEGTVEDIVYRNEENGWTVAAILPDDGSKRLSAVGVMPFLTPGQHVAFEGTLGEHRDYGTQIRVTGYTASMPATLSAVEKYLGSGLIRGIGPSTAARIVKHFGKDTMDIMERSPERLAEVSGIGKKRAAMIAESFIEQNSLRTTMMFLQKFGLANSLSMRICNTYGEMTEQIVRRMPYRLADEIEGVGFKTADAIAREMGFTAEDPSRLRSGVKYVLSEAVNTDGHTYLPEERLTADAAAILGAREETVRQVIGEMVMKDALSEEILPEGRALYLPNVHRAEQECAELLLYLTRAAKARKPSGNDPRAEIAEFEAETGVTLGAEQAEAVLAAATEGVSVITGGPGTGKTTSINCVIRLTERMGKLELCAPTGRAAKRMSEATGHRARTIHRLLECGGEGDMFGRNEENPLDADIVIVDEMSMVDIFLMRALLRALKPGTKLVLVGDADQLPSVGAGNVLRDLIDADVIRVSRLTEIFRQAQQSMIVMNAHRINRGEYPVLRVKDTDFFLERKDTVKAVTESVIALVQSRLPKYLSLPDEKGIQVMTPMKRGEAGVYAFNAALQTALNPAAPGRPELHRGETVFRLGDRVMQIRNDYELEWTNDDGDGAGVFNGDIGYITKVNRIDAALTVRFDDGREAEYGSKQLEELELAYCMSVHKSQGSEFEAVVLPLLGGPPMLMTRNLLYTAVTRAKRLVVVVGREGCIRQMVENNRITRRYSSLALRLKGEI